MLQGRKTERNSRSPSDERPNLDSSGALACPPERPSRCSVAGQARAPVLHWKMRYGVLLQLHHIGPHRDRADGFAAGHDGEGDLGEVLLRAFVEAGAVDEDTAFAVVEAARPLRLVTLP